MLVSENIVRQWYRKDSWVYRNFEYLFKNPLWSKEPPTGFSVCPYFWLSLFSFFIFRPTAVGLSRIVAPTVSTVIGHPFAALDRWLVRQIRRFIFGRRDEDAVKYKELRGIGLLFLFLLLIFSVVIGGSTYYLARWYVRDVTQAAIFMVEFWAVVGGIVLAVTAAIHAWLRRSKELPRCRTEAYLYVWAVLVLVALFVFAPDNSRQFLADCAACLWMILQVIWTGIVATVHWIGHALWLVVWFVCRLVWFILTFAPAGGFIPWWAYVGGGIGLLALSGWITDRWMKQIERRMDARDLRARNRERWLDVMSELLFSEYWVNHVADDGNEDRKQALKSMAPVLLRRLCELHWKEQLDMLQEYAPTHTIPQFKHLKKMEKVISRIKLAWAVVPDKNVRERLAHWELDMNRMKADIYRVQTDVQFKRQLDSATERFAALRKRCEEKRKRAGESRLHKACVNTTTAILNVVRAIGRLAAAGAGAVWHGIRWLGRQTAIFCVYLWTLIKAKKQGACPYFRFE